MFSTQQKQHMRPFSSAPLFSVRVNGFGRAESRASANILCGQLHTRNVGQLIALLKKASPTRLYVHSMTMLRTRLTVRNRMLVSLRGGGVN
jgi:hypothetical protein